MELELCKTCESKNCENIFVHATLKIQGEKVLFYCDGYYSASEHNV